MHSRIPFRIPGLRLKIVFLNRTSNTYHFTETNEGSRWLGTRLRNRRLCRNKSDTADAQLIASFFQAEQQRFVPWTPPTAENEQLIELSRYADVLTQDTAMDGRELDMTVLADVKT